MLILTGFVPVFRTWLFTLSEAVKLERQVKMGNRKARRKSIEISELSYVIHRAMMSNYRISQTEIIEAFTLAQHGSAVLRFGNACEPKFWGYQMSLTQQARLSIRLFEANSLQELPDVLGLYVEESKAA